MNTATEKPKRGPGRPPKNGQAPASGPAAGRSEAPRITERAFIDDGYSRTVGFRRVPGVHPEMVFTYRPMVGPEAGAALRRLGAASEQDRAQVEADLILDRLERWEFDAEMTADNIKRLNGTLYSRLYGVIMGHAAPDFEIMDDGSQINAPKPDEQQLELDAGNSPAG